MVRTYSHCYSHEHGLDVRVLGGSKPLDIVSVAQLALQCARDDNDQGAFGHLDIKNYHDNLSWTEMWRSQRRRGIPDALCCAAVRLQRCPGIRLAVKGSKTDCIAKTRGALTGNSLAPWFGRLIVEDAFLAVQTQVKKFCFKFMDVTLKPMAWSDNVVAFANYPARVAKIISIVAQQLERMHLHMEDVTSEIVPASSRRQHWRSLRCGFHK